MCEVKCKHYKQLTDTREMWVQRVLVSLITESCVCAGYECIGYGSHQYEVVGATIVRFG